MIGDIFEQRTLSPMLIGQTNNEPFNSKDHIFELKLDGIRCIAYLDNKINISDLRNKRNQLLYNTYPELKDINKSVKRRCILDGELVVLSSGKPDFYELQSRSLMTDKFKVEIRAAQNPVRFVAFDILYLGDKSVMDLELMERKVLLQENVIESDELAYSRYVDQAGIEFYNMVMGQDLEGIVAKRKESKYFPGKRTTDWLKIKNIQDDDFIICGYEPNEKGIKSFIIASVKNDAYVYMGHVGIGLSREAINYVLKFAEHNKAECPFEENKYNENIIWIKPQIICSVKYMEKSPSGMLRQPVFKGLSLDKTLKMLNKNKPDI